MKKIKIGSAYQRHSFTSWSIQEYKALRPAIRGDNALLQNALTNHKPEHRRPVVWAGIALVAVVFLGIFAKGLLGVSL